MAERQPNSELGSQSPLASPLLVASAAAALFHLYASIAGTWPLSAFPIVPTYTHRQLHLGIVLVLLFAGLAAQTGGRLGRVTAAVLAIASFAALAATVWLGDDLLAEIVDPSPLATMLGLVVIGLVLEATRRTTGIAMPLIACVFIVYALGGRFLPEPWSHRGYDVERIVGHVFIGPEGIFGTPLSVSATLIVLFTIYGAILNRSGAAEAFVGLAGRIFGSSKRSAVGTVVLSSFLLGGPSGSGTATTVMIGNVAYPLLRSRGYSPSQSGGLLAAAGLGAVISPPVLGSAAFLLAEMLAITYADVLKMVVLPTLIYYASVYLIAILNAPLLTDVRPTEPAVKQRASAFEVSAHLLSASCILIFLAMGFSPETSAVFSILTAIVLWVAVSNRRPSIADIVSALADGMRNTIPIAAICACAGMIIGVITLTGLGLKLSGIVVYLAGDSLLLASLLAGIAVWLVGLAVPITGSYIICAIVVAPALIAIGVAPVSAHMFIFYMAVLSEVSPPIAMAPFAAAAITGASPLATTLQAWRFTIPIFLMPFALVLEPVGQVLLLETHTPLAAIAIELSAYIAGNLALIFALCGYVSMPLSAVERLLFAVAALLLMFPSTLASILSMPSAPEIWTGALILCLTLAFHLQKGKKAAAATGGSEERS